MSHEIDRSSAVLLQWQRHGLRRFMSAAAPAHTDGASAHARIWRARRFQWVRRRCKRQPTSQEAEAASSNTLLNALRVFSVIIGARLGTHSTSSGRLQLRRWARARVARLRRLLLCCLLHVVCCMFCMFSAARCLLHVVRCTLSAEMLHARCFASSGMSSSSGRAEHSTMSSRKP